MSTQTENRQKFIKYLKNHTKYSKRDFDDALKSAKAYAEEYGMSDEDLILISTVGFSQKLGITRLKLLIRTLIPINHVPEVALQNVLNWLMKHYYNEKYDKHLKVVLEWLAGLVEYDLLTTDLLNLHYDVFYMFFDIDAFIPTVTSIACKLIYLLTKPEDVSRWYVKQILEYHEVSKYSKQSGVLLYLFKTYRPDCVPEQIPAYTIHSAFRQNEFNTHLQKAAERSYLQVQKSLVIVWNKPDFHKSVARKRKRDEELIPKAEYNEMNFYQANFKSLLCIKSLKDLHTYNLVSNTPNRVQTLITNAAGCQILAFADKVIQARFSYQLYYTLYNAFIQRKPNISYMERDNFLQKVGLFQNYLQLGLPVVSKFLADYLVNWDGYEHQKNIYKLLPWIHFTSFDWLRECVLHYIRAIFVVSSVETKCLIFQVLADLIVNIISTIVYRKKYKTKSVFMDVKITWNVEDIQKLFDYVEKMCLLGLYLENRRAMIILSIIRLNQKILLRSENEDIHIKWKIAPYLAYSALFSCNPVVLDEICKLITRFPDAVDRAVTKDLINCLWFSRAFQATHDYSVFQKLPESIKLRLSKIPHHTKLFNLKNNLAFACFNYNDLLKSSLDGDAFLKNIKVHCKEVAKFIDENLHEEHV